MTTQPLLLFEHDGARFGVDATKVRESVWLPELTPVEEAPPWIVGIFNLRGQIIPVADLYLRFEHPAQRYSTANHIVVLETERLPMGIIVSEVPEVIDLPSDAIQSPPQFDTKIAGSTHLVAGEAQVGDDLVTLLDVSRLTELAEETELTEGAELPEETKQSEETELIEVAQQPARVAYFCPDATPAERVLFRKRAQELQKSVANNESTGLGLAVVELGGELFGVELVDVVEFCDITELCPIPCCPPHVLGAMNLRGELLTLIDPRFALNLPPAERGSKAVVAHMSSELDADFGEKAMGIAVDQVHDVVYLCEEELQPPPAALRELCGASITGTAPYADRTMTVLDLPVLLAREEWIVNENV
jgi:purine-binding chemotaxis protein CheW